MSPLYHQLLRMFLLAQGDAGVPADGAADGSAGGGGVFGDPLFIVMIMGVMIMFYLMVARPQRQKQKDTQKMMANLKENDQVVTVGGIVGAIVNFSKDGAEVVIRTDEKSNTKLRILRSHISRPLAVEDESAAEPSDLSKKS